MTDNRFHDPTVLINEPLSDNLHRLARKVSTLRRKLFANKTLFNLNRCGDFTIIVQTAPEQFA